jgi:hypothetical protein
MKRVSDEIAALVPANVDILARKSSMRYFTYVGLRRLINCVYLKVNRALVKQYTNDKPPILEIRGWFRISKR